MPGPNAGAPTANPPLGYPDLAWLAEMADGLEGEDLVIAFVQGENKAVVETLKQATDADHQILLKGIKVVRTAPDKTHPVEETLIKLKGENDPRTARINGEACDAVFTTASAMRKFVLLYYDSQKILDADERAKLLAAMSDPEVPAIGHIHPSVSAGIGIDTGIRILKTTKGATAKDAIGAAALRAAAGEWQTLDNYKPPKP